MECDVALHPAGHEIAREREEAGGDVAGRGEQVEPGEDVQEIELEDRCAGEDVAARLPGGQRFVQPPSAVRQLHQRPRDQRDPDAG
jgi:hypothetical protein